MSLYGTFKVTLRLDCFSSCVEPQLTSSPNQVRPARRPGPPPSGCRRERLWFHGVSLLTLQARSKTGPASSSNSSNESFGTKKARASFGRGFFKLRGGKQTGSASNLGECRAATGLSLSAEACSLIDVLFLQPRLNLKAQSTWTWLGLLHEKQRIKPLCRPHRKPKRRPKASGDSLAGNAHYQTFTVAVGAKSLLFSTFSPCRLKRSHSTSFNLDDAADTDFRRGGVRATAGPRLGWSRESKRT